MDFPKSGHIFKLPTGPKLPRLGSLSVTIDNSGYSFVKVLNYSTHTLRKTEEKKTAPAVNAMPYLAWIYELFPELVVATEEPPIHLDIPGEGITRADNGRHHPQQKQEVIG